MFKVLAFLAAGWLALVYYSYATADGHQGHSSYLEQLLYNPLVQCRLYGGSCMSIDACNTTLNIYKDVCKSYSYDNVCCISRTAVCKKFSGFCTNDSSICITSANLFNQFGHGHHIGYGHGHGKPYTYKTVALSWLACNSTHRCCHPVKVRRGYGQGGHGGHGGHGGYGGQGGYGGGNGGSFGGFGFAKK